MSGPLGISSRGTGDPLVAHPTVNGLILQAMMALKLEL